jgi:hypothetical protein
VHKHRQRDLAEIRDGIKLRIKGYCDHEGVVPRGVVPRGVDVGVDVDVGEDVGEGEGAVRWLWWPRLYQMTHPWTQQSIMNTTYNELWRIAGAWQTER